MSRTCLGRRWRPCFHSPLEMCSGLRVGRRDKAPETVAAAGWVGPAWPMSRADAAIDGGGTGGTTTDEALGTDGWYLGDPLAIESTRSRSAFPFARARRASWAAPTYIPFLAPIRRR